jgi:alpha-galactosidase
MRRFNWALGALLIFGVWVEGARAEPTSTPPMGWNSWDAYGLTIDEAQFKANATVLAGLKALGWRYAVIDEGWYMANPAGAKLADRRYQLDGHGLLIPDQARFPSMRRGEGFKALAEWTHDQGLLFGIHIVRGIPKEAVAKNLPLGVEGFTAKDAADVGDTCPWDDGNFGVKDSSAGQAYYDLMMRQYAAWGLDFLKVDCISDHPYKGSEIRQIADAIGKTGRPIVLSLSPGPTQLVHADEVSRYAQLWRISDDVWDGWTFPHTKPGNEFPVGVGDAFARLALWAPHVKSGHWPDADMLPFGTLAPSPGWGRARRSRLTQDEERSQFLLWCIARSPLILGSNLTRLDEYTRSLISNENLIALDQASLGSHPLTQLPAGFEKASVWVSRLPAGEGSKQVIAIFNRDDSLAAIHATWIQLGMDTPRHVAHDLFGGEPRAASDALEVHVPPHGAVAYQLD